MATGCLAGQETAQIATGELVAVTILLEKRAGTNGGCLGGALSRQAGPAGDKAAGDILLFGLAALALGALTAKPARHVRRR